MPYEDLRLATARDRMRRYEDEAAEARLAHEARLAAVDHTGSNRGPVNRFRLRPAGPRSFTAHIRRPAFLRFARG